MMQPKISHLATKLELNLYYVNCENLPDGNLHLMYHMTQRVHIYEILIKQLQVLHISVLLIFPNPEPWYNHFCQTDLMIISHRPVILCSTAEIAFSACEASIHKTIAIMRIPHQDI